MHYRLPHPGQGLLGCLLIYLADIILTASCLALLQQIIEDIYALQLIEHAHMVTCNPSWTPVDIESKLGPEGVPVKDPTLHRSLAEGLQYLTFTRSDLSYAVQHICLYMQDPREPHFAALKRCPSTRRSTLGYYVFLGDNILSWSAKRQHIISHSSAEVEYQGVANVVIETAWIRNLLHELHSPLSTATLV
nr:hypothetical protein [Tanacetum cinerariifolium]